MKTGSKVKKQLNSLERALHELKSNLAHDRQASNLHVNSIEYLNAEMNSIKGSLGGMMELIVGEIDSIKKELYLDFGQNQKILFEDITDLKNGRNEMEDRWRNFELVLEKNDK